MALITGAGSGIGRDASLLFAAEGASVVAVDRDEATAAETVALIRDEAERDPAPIRVASPSPRTSPWPPTARRWWRPPRSAYGRLDVLFNNAGVMLPSDDDALTTDEAIWDTTMDVNAKGVFLGCKYGIPALRRAGGGAIVNTASFVAMMGAATPQVAYTASKGAVLAFSRELAVIHARESIRVNALCPGPLRTELLMKFLDTDEKQQRRLVHIPMGRFGEAAEIAKAALFLASDESSFMTGADFVVDGGITAAYVTPE